MFLANGSYKTIMMEDKVIYEVQGEIPPTYCCDGKEAVEKLNKLHKAVDAALGRLSNNKK